MASDPASLDGRDTWIIAACPKTAIGLSNFEYDSKFLSTDRTKTVAVSLSVGLYLSAGALLCCPQGTSLQLDQDYAWMLRELDPPTVALWDT